MDAVLAFLGFITILALWTQLLGVIFSYEIGRSAISYRFLGSITLGRIKYDSIEDIRVVTAWPILHADGVPQDHTMIFALRWPSKVFVRSCVYVRTRNSFAKVFILSPRDPGKFVKEVIQHIQRVD